MKCSKSQRSKKLNNNNNPAFSESTGDWSSMRASLDLKVQ